MNKGSNEKLWFNQQLMYYKDYVYGTNGVLEISIANNSNDFKNFTPIVLNISIISQSNIRKLYSITYCNSVDMIMSFKDVILNSSQIYNSNQKYEIIKKYYSDRILKFEFLKNKNNNENVVVVSIINDSSDYNMIIIPFYVFSSITGLIRSFANDFTNLNINFINRSLLTEMLEQNKLIKNSIQVLPSTIVDFNHSEDNKSHNNVNSNIDISGDDSNFMNIDISESVEEISEVELYDNKTISNTNDILNNFENYLSENIDNIDLGIPEEKTKVIHSTSNFISHFKDISNIENLLNSIVVHDNPCNIINDELKNIGLNIDLSTSMENDDYKSYVYLSSLIYKVILRQYTEHGTSIPQNFQVMKYEVKENLDVEHLELAYDLLTIMSYLKCFRSNIQERESDGFRNKSIFFLTFRIFFDIYSFSFLENVNKQSLKSIIISRFKLLEDNKFFDSFTEILLSYNLEKIKENQISSFVEAVCEKIIGNGIFISKYHNGLYESNNCRLRYYNNFNEEQIIKYILPLEISEKLGININDDNEIIKFIDPEVIPSQIFDIFRTNKKSVKKSTKKENVTNLERFCKFNEVDIPKDIKKIFFNYIREIEFNDFDYDYFYKKNPNFIIEDMSQLILLGIYEWNSSENKKELYKDFVFKIEGSSMTKDLIISKFKTSIPIDDDVSDDWDTLDFS